MKITLGQFWYEIEIDICSHINNTNIKNKKPKNYKSSFIIIVVDIRQTKPKNPSKWNDKMNEKQIDYI